jgi:hypothetical protein
MEDRERQEQVPTDREDRPEGGRPLYYVQLPGGYVATSPTSYPPDDAVPANSSFPYPPTCR